MSTSRGIQAESLLKRSGSCSAPAKDGAWAVPAPTPQRTSRSWSARSFFGQDPERQVELAHQLLERVAEQPAPTLPDVAQLAGERARACLAGARSSSKSVSPSGPNAGPSARDASSVAIAFA